MAQTGKALTLDDYRALLGAVKSAGLFVDTRGDLEEKLRRHIELKEKQQQYNETPEL